MANQGSFWQRFKLWWQRLTAQRQDALRPLPYLPRQRYEFVVIGLGRFGTSAAQKLAAYGHDVLVIDKRADRIEQLRRDLPHLVQLDATNTNALNQIDIGRFQTALVCMSSDFESTLLTTVLLLRAGVGTVIVKARTHTQGEILKELGAHQVVLPEHEVAEHLARRLALHNFVDYLDIGDGISIIELLAPAQLVGKSLGESDLRQRHGLTVIAVRRNRELISNTGADFRIQQNDELLVVGRVEDAERLGT